MQKQFRKVLIVLISMWFAGYSWSQSQDQQVYSCTILPSPKSDQPKSAFCNGCDYWPGGIIPYEFHANVNPTQREQMLDAMSRLEGIANIDFIPRNGHSDFIRIVSGNTNSSYIGRQGGGQNVTIVSWSVPMVICHELLHALGFHHEQSRPDRNTYVTVHTGNICPGESHNFDIATTGVTPNIPYDFNSIMHYWGYSFSRCTDVNDNCLAGCPNSDYVGPTITVNPPYNNSQNIIGNVYYISRTDSLMLRFVYPYPGDRFVNNANVGPGPYFGQTLYNALKTFTADPLILGAIPPGSDVWFMPGIFENAEGTYTKPMTLRAPFGGVVLR